MTNYKLVIPFRQQLARLLRVLGPTRVDKTIVLGVMPSLNVSRLLQQLRAPLDSEKSIAVLQRKLHRGEEQV